MHKDRDYAGIVALVLALSIGTAFTGTLLIISGPWDPDPLSEAGANLLSLLAGGMVAMLGHYMGATRHKGDDAARSPPVMDQQPPAANTGPDSPTGDKP
jgi:hypothetical protein